VVAIDNLGFTPPTIFPVEVSGPKPPPVRALLKAAINPIT